MQGSVVAACSAAWKKVFGKQRAPLNDEELEFVKGASALAFSAEAAHELLQEHRGDRVAAMSAMAQTFADSFAHELDAREDTAPPARAEAEEDESSEDEHVPEPVA